MPDTKISNLTELTSVASNDEMVIVDKSDTSMAASGTTKKILFSAVKPIEMTAASSASPTKLDFFEDTDNGTNKVTIQAPDAVTSDRVVTLPDSTGTVITNGSINAATEKTTPVDADEIGIIDSAASYVLKKITLAKLKIALWAGFSPPQGFLINGKISVTDTGSGLTVAMKTLAGTDPSSTDPVYCRIGDTVRSITSALSVTKADGTNWCAAGSAELATKEIDYFVYLGYNATDGVVIGFSRIPYATQYSDFGTITTNEKYCAISTITTAASTDYYENIGRFAATLSAGAGYTWSVPTYTSINLIQRPIYETRWLSAVPTYNNTIGNGTNTLNYRIVGNKIQAQQDFVVGSTTTAGTTLNWKLPFACLSNTRMDIFGSAAILDSGTRYYPVVAWLQDQTHFSWLNQNDAGSGQLSSTTPMTWATGDDLKGQFEYRI